MEGEEDRGADEGVGFAEFVLEEALPGPVKEAEVVTMDDKPGGVRIGLDDVFRLRMGIFQAGGLVLEDASIENLV